MFGKPHLGRITACVTLLWLGGMCPVWGAGLKQLPGHVPAAIKNLTAIGRLPATNELHLAIGLALRDPAGLDQFLADVCNPASPNYRHFLTTAEYTARFCPTEADYAAVKNFARTNGFKISGEHGNRLLLDVTAKTADLERAFHLHLEKYHHPTENRNFFAPDAEPTVDAGLPVADVSGLSDYYRPHPKLVKRNPPLAAPKNGSAPGGSYMGDDFRNAYVPGVTNTGAGQSVGLFQLDGYYPNDIAAYAQTTGGGRTNIQVITVPVGSTNWNIGTNGGNGEVSLDIEMAMSMAPGLSKILVFEGPNANWPNDILNAMLASNAICKNLSSSWGWPGGPVVSTDHIFQLMAAAGQSFFNASGDSDAFTVGPSSVNGVDNISTPNAPSSSPYITQVGGTTLTMNGSGSSYASETVWNWGLDQGSYVGSSGGVSSYYPIPSWQTNISMTANLGSTTQRNIPDVALTADNVYVISGGSGAGSGGNGGTSCAAPLWAGFMALVNQQYVAVTGQATNSVGFINPAIYAIGRGQNIDFTYATCFHDTTSGNNYWPSSPANYPATTGYDLCTGWGTPNTNLINALAAPASALVISPVSGFTAFGLPGGPFSPSSQILMLTNTSASSFNWSATDTSTWLNLSSTNGTLNAAGYANVTISVTTNANGLAAGNYSATVAFSNKTSHAAQSLYFTLAVSTNLVQNGGFETGDFTNWTLSDNGGPDQVDNGSLSSITPYDGSYEFIFGQANSPAYLSQNLMTSPGQTYLFSFWLCNPTNGATETFQASWNGGTVYSIYNPGVLAWTNEKFVVTATSTSTVIQFAAQNDPWYFGLDDVSVIPVNPPAITQQPLSETNAVGGNVVFSATVTGTAPLSFHWRTNGVNLVNNAVVSGATTNTLTLTGISTTNAGNYTLVVTNAYGAITSSVATLTVVVATPMTNQLTISTVGLGTFSPNYSNAWLNIGQGYSITSAPAAGFVFTHWTVSTNWLGGVTVNSTNLNFVMQSNLTLLATFVETSRPTLLITAPTNNQHLTNALAYITGTNSDNWGISGVWYRVNSNTWNAVTATTNQFINWTQVATLLAGTNTVNAYAVNFGGLASLTNTVSFVSSNTFALQLLFTNVQPLQTNGLSFSLQLSPGLNGHIQVSTNLASVTNWMTLTNFTGSNTVITFRDPGATNSNQRYYRAVIP